MKKHVFLSFLLVLVLTVCMMPLAKATAAGPSNITVSNTVVDTTGNYKNKEFGYMILFYTYTTTTENGQTIYKDFQEYKAGISYTKGDGSSGTLSGRSFKLSDGQKITFHLPEVANLHYCVYENAMDIKENGEEIFTAKSTSGGSTYTGTVTLKKGGIVVGVASMPGGCSERTYEDGTTQYAPNLITVPSSATISFTNTYKYNKYNATYAFTSVTSGKSLPASVTKLLPAKETDLSDGSVVTAKDPSKKQVSVSGGKWIFQGYTASSQTIDGADISFTGQWKYQKNEKTTPAKKPDPPVTEPGGGGTTTGPSQSTGSSETKVQQAVLHKSVPQVQKAVKKATETVKASDLFKDFKGLTMEDEFSQEVSTTGSNFGWNGLTGTLLIVFSITLSALLVSIFSDLRVLAWYAAKKGNRR